MIFGKHISVIIPALNESESIGRVIAEIPDGIDRIVVVDNGSIDGTDVIAMDLGAEVIYEPNRGYGAACMTGIKAVLGSDVIAFIDGDYSDFPDQLISVINPVASGSYDLAIGCRDGNNNVQLPLHQRLGNWMACCVIQLLHGCQFSDLGPMRCISRELLLALNMSDANYGWTTEMQLKAAIARAKIVQVPVSYRMRIGQSKISGTLKGSIMAGYKIFYWVIRLWLIRLFLIEPKSINSH